MAPCAWQSVSAPCHLSRCLIYSIRFLASPFIFRFHTESGFFTRCQKPDRPYHLLFSGIAFYFSIPYGIRFFYSMPETRPSLSAFIFWHRLLFFDSIRNQVFLPDARNQTVLISFYFLASPFIFRFHTESDFFTRCQKPDRPRAPCPAPITRSQPTNIRIRPGQSRIRRSSYSHSQGEQHEQLNASALSEVENSIKKPVGCSGLPESIPPGFY